AKVENEAVVGKAFETGQGVAGVRGLRDGKTGGFERVDDNLSQRGFVFDNEYSRPNGHGVSGHGFKVRRVVPIMSVSGNAFVDSNGNARGRLATAGMRLDVIVAPDATRAVCQTTGVPVPHTPPPHTQRRRTPFSERVTALRRAELAGVSTKRPGPVRDQPTRATPPRWKPRGGDPGVLGEEPLSRLTPPRPSGGAPNAAAALGCLGRPFAATRMRHSRNDRYSPLEPKPRNREPGNLSIATPSESGSRGSPSGWRPRRSQ